MDLVVFGMVYNMVKMVITAVEIEWSSGDQATQDEQLIIQNRHANIVIYDSRLRYLQGFADH